MKLFHGCGQDVKRRGLIGLLPVDGSAIELLTHEQIGNTTKQGVAIRDISGVPPHVKADFTILGIRLIILG